MSRGKQSSPRVVGDPVGDAFFIISDHGLAIYGQGEGGFYFRGLKEWAQGIAGASSSEQHSTPGHPNRSPVISCQLNHRSGGGGRCSGRRRKKLTYASFLTQYLPMKVRKSLDARDLKSQERLHHHFPFRLHNNEERRQRKPQLRASSRYIFYMRLHPRGQLEREEGIHHPPLAISDGKHLYNMTTSAPKASPTSSPLLLCTGRAQHPPPLQHLGFASH